MEKIGSPDKKSPVIITSNYLLTVARVRDALEGLNCFIVKLPTSGINVWCGAAGGLMTTEKVILCIEAFGLANLVDHKVLIMPPLAASGVSKWKVFDKTGWDIQWGPVDIRSLEKYLSGNSVNSVALGDRLVHFGVAEALEMSCALTGSIFIRFSLIVFLLLGFSAFCLLPFMALLSSLSSFLGRTFRGKITLLLHPYVTIMPIVLLFAALSSHAALPVLPWWKLSLLGLFLSLLMNWSVDSYLPFRTCRYSGTFFGIGARFSVLNDGTCVACGECLHICPVGALTMTTNSVEICNGKCVGCGACQGQCKFNAIMNTHENVPVALCRSSA